MHHCMGPDDLFHGTGTDAPCGQLGQQCSEKGAKREPLGHKHSLLSLLRRSFKHHPERGDFVHPSLHSLAAPLPQSVLKTLSRPRPAPSIVMTILLMTIVHTL